MTVMNWGDAKARLLGYTDTYGWERHSCRQVWFVAHVVSDPEDELWGDVIFMTPPGQPNWVDIEEPVLVYTTYREARMVAEHAGDPWRTLNLYDLLRFEDGRKGARYAGSRRLLDELGESWNEKRRREQG